MKECLNKDCRIKNTKSERYCEFKSKVNSINLKTQIKRMSARMLRKDALV